MKPFSKLLVWCAFDDYVSELTAFSNKQWLSNPAALEGCEFGDVIIKCTPDEELRKWLHMHLGIRIERIIYT